MDGFWSSRCLWKRLGEMLQSIFLKKKISKFIYTSLKSHSENVKGIHGMYTRYLGDKKVQVAYCHPPSCSCGGMEEPFGPCWGALDPS